MIIMNDQTEYDLGPSVCALGTFDGIHIGHQMLIRRAVSLAQASGEVGIVCCFDRHPMEVLRHGAAPVRLLTSEEKEKKLEALGVDVMYIQTFTREFADMEPEEYLSDLHQRLCARVIVAGENYTFGRRGRGNAQLLQLLGRRLGVEVVIVPAVQEEGVTVSSTRIRELLLQGDKEHAERLLALR